MLKRALVSAGLIRAPAGHPEEGKLLMSRRLEGAHLAGSWEFPGGKVELGEDPADTLRRELREELNIDVRLGTIYAVGHHRYPEKDVVLLVYECWHTGGTPEALEVAEFAWLSPREVCELPLPPADEEVIERLRGELTEPITLSAPEAQAPVYRCELIGLEDTRALGVRLGALLREAHQAQRTSQGTSSLAQLPLLLAAHGELGAGKTSLAQGIARGLGVSTGSYVNSPTFSLLQSHPVEGDDELYFHHLDLYRLEDEDELDSLGFDEVVSDGVSFVEWPTRGPKLFQRPHWRVELSYPDEGASARHLKLSLHGLSSSALMTLMSLTSARLTQGSRGRS